jgi:beta-glucosidase
MLARSLVLCWFGFLIAAAEVGLAQANDGNAETTKPAPAQIANAQPEPAAAPVTPFPWSNRALSADERARLILGALTLDEKIALVHARIGTPFQGRPEPQGALHSAGYAPGIPRLGIPPLQETDAGLGVANPTSAPFNATALPSGLALGATFDPALARQGGAMIGGEARAFGFNVMLAGGANLARDPRNGRNFEYIGEDPLLTGVMAGAVIDGIQSRGIVSTIKHYAVNAQETGRVVLSSDLSEEAARESDLLAFEIALERGHPRALMTGYNAVNGVFASENAFLLDTVLKQDWHYPGWVMSDWGGMHSTDRAALAGLDQESGDNLDPGPYFAAPLKAAVEAGRVPMARLDDMVLRVLRGEIAAGVFDDPPKPGGAIDEAADATVAEAVARRGIVLLKNDGPLLPLSHELRRVLVVGDHVDFGVLSGGGSSQVVPRGALRLEGEPPGRFFGKPKLYDPSSPLSAVKRALPDATVDFRDGHDIAAAAEAARGADVVLLFAEQWMNESRDAPSLALPKNQDALIAAVAAANPRAVVILETGGPVTMPWLAAVPAVLEAWYPGARGAEAIAALLFGADAPSGRLPMTFPAAETQLPRPAVRDANTTTANPGEPIKGPFFSVDYNIEGADVGYRWFARTRQKPLFPFGFGLSYTRFAHRDMTVSVLDGAVTASLTVENVGARAGIDTPQIYLDSPDHLFARRFVGWAEVALKPGETKRVQIAIDPRLLARFDVSARRWHIAKGRYVVAARDNAAARGPEAGFRLAAQDLAP